MVGDLRATSRRAYSILLATLLAALVLAFAAMPAHAEEDDQGNRSIQRYNVLATANSDGTIDVDLTMEFDFADTPGHGPYLTLVTRQEIEADPNHYRALEITDVTASSPSGAPADLYLEEDDAGLVIRVGNEAVDDVSGVQTYEISYTVAGVPNSGVGDAGEDEIYWNVIGSAWEIPINGISVRLDGPADMLETACWVGDVGSDTPCQGLMPGGSAVNFRQDHLDPGEGMSVVASFPGNTFGGVQPILVHRRTFANSLGLGGPGAPIAGALALVGAAAVGLRARQRGRDEQFLGLTPGLMPTEADSARTGVRVRSPIAVQFTPPEGVRPGLMGTLTDERADPRDVTATIIDLAVRGHLRISERQSVEGRPDWNLQRTDDEPGGTFNNPELLPYEREVLRGIFHGNKHKVRISELTSFGDSMALIQQELYSEVMARRWFRRSPAEVRTQWVAAGAVVVTTGAILAPILGYAIGQAFLGVAAVVVGVVMIVAARAMPARTAAGTAVLAQSLGFKHYLETAEANQIRFEEGEDVFSRYLPYAIVFGVAERWAAIFAELARQGHAVPEPTWYTGHAMVGGMFWAGNFGSAMTSFSSAAAQSVSSPAPATPGSSGSSAFSGGGGFSGGGVGGGGGGGW